MTQIESDQNANKHSEQIGSSTPTPRRMVTSVLNVGYLDVSMLKKYTYIYKILTYFSRNIRLSMNQIVYAMLSDEYIPSSYIDSSYGVHDYMNYKSNMNMHSICYPESRTLPSSSSESSSQSWHFEGIIMNYKSTTLSIQQYALDFIHYIQRDCSLYYTI